MGKTRFSTQFWVVFLLSAVLLGSVTTWGKVIYVDDDAAGANNGTSWADAYKFLQDALANANSSEKPVEIRVSQGVYQPDRSAPEPNGTGNREATFQLINGVALKGGYAGFGEPDADARDIELYKSILSGDLYGDDVEVADPCNLLKEPSRTENSYHVVVGSGTDATAVLDGFTLTGGNANVAPQQEGAGMYNDQGSPVVGNCSFWANSASHAGAGIANYRSSSPTLSNCVFNENSAMPACGGEGGGIFNFWYSNPTLTNCTFTRNVSWSGGGMCNDSSCSPALTGCAFAGNRAVGGGGIQNVSHSSPTLTNCIFSGNQASKDGGAVHNFTRSNSTLINCTFAANTAPNGSSIACDSLQQRAPCRLQITNSILWDDGEEIWNNDGSTISIRHSNVQGVWLGVANIDADPCFADPNNGDYHLKSQAGRWEPNEGRWVMDEVTSPCIDAGDPMAPIMHEAFPSGGIINMGAYGGTEKASKSYFGEPPCETIVAGDINGDCLIDFKDFYFVALHWMEEHN